MAVFQVKYQADIRLSCPEHEAMIFLSFMWKNRNENTYALKDVESEKRGFPMNGKSSAAELYFPSLLFEIIFHLRPTGAF